MSTQESRSNIRQPHTTHQGKADVGFHSIVNQATRIEEQPPPFSQLRMKQAEKIICQNNAMNISPGNTSVSPIQGQLLRLSTRRQVAIYRREDTLWVADFIDGQGELMDATTWFRFNCGTLATTHAQRRMVRESAIPISSQLVAKIERLHCDAVAAAPTHGGVPRVDPKMNRSGAT